MKSGRNCNKSRGSQNRNHYRAYWESENPTFRNLATHALCSHFPFTWQKAITNCNWQLAKSIFNKIDVTRSNRNISSQEFHSALGKISVINFMYSLLRQKNSYGLKI
jgi:hypothetical protein